ncbi:MAG: N-acetylmuramoyl-L-alanine amidase [Chitinophagaceae bacterium]|nr:N-acetylmuramoyl-L-alanine amidase [Chitinophagaceae bacterium]
MRKLFICIVIFFTAALLFSEVQAQQDESSRDRGKAFQKSFVLPVDSAGVQESSNESRKTFSGVGSALAKYNRANERHRWMLDSLGRVLFAYPLVDSPGLKYAREWVGTPNMGLRRPNFVIIHHTANNSCEETLKEFTTAGGREASAHYVICKDGTVHHMLNDLLRSHHAGESRWGNNTDLNSSSIGIELVNNGYEEFTEEQISSLLLLLERLKAAYKIPTANFIGHGDVAPTRKNDPSVKFPWKLLSEYGFGYWWQDTTGLVVPAEFDHMMALRIIGYDISNPQAAIAAFKRHFMADSSKGMNEKVRKVIYALHKKYLVPEE